MSNEKTKGQRLYEFKHPVWIRVYRDVFDREGMMVLNPEHQVGWQFITKKCKDSWETTAVGHYFFSRP